MIDEEFGPRATAYIGTQWFGAFNSAGDLVGVGGALVSMIEPCTVYLNRSYVEPAWRGLGLQRKLITARIAWARSLKDIKTVTTDTYEVPASTNNLIACGFRAYEPKQKWRGEGATYWKLEI